MNRLHSIILTVICLYAVSCIRNDIPYPEVDAAITKLEADGTESVSIDADAREVLLTMEETADLGNVNIREVSFNDEAVSSSESIVGRKNLSQPLSVTLSAYEDDYDWTIKAEQPIARYFSISGQAGEAVIEQTCCGSNPVGLRYHESCGVVH